MQCAGLPGKPCTRKVVHLLQGKRKKNKLYCLFCVHELNLIAHYARRKAKKEMVE